MKYYKFFIFFLLFLVNNFVLSQTISQKEDELEAMFNKLYSIQSDSSKIELNAKILKSFSSLLKNSESLKYDFEKLTKISIQTSENKKVRIITWQIQFSSGVFSYFGFIQSNANKNDILLYQLNDKSEEISNIENAVFTPEKWYGTLYYKIVTNKYKKDTYYTLLGWDGNDNLTNKKIIDVLYFDSNNNPVFGKPVFSYENKIQNRIIFEYGEQVKMLLNFDEDYKMIIWDHLAPSSPALKDKFQYYGPDFSYDGLKFNKGIWEFYPKITPKNKTDNNSGKKPKSSNNLH